MVRIFVEGPTDKQIIELLLGDLRHHGFVVEAAGGKDAARPLVRKVLVIDREPVAFIFDTDSSNADRSAEQVEILRSYFQLSAADVPLLLLPMQPSIEILLVDDPQVLEDRLHRPLSPSERIAAKFEPKGFLDAHAGDLGVKDSRDLIRSLQPAEVDLLRNDDRVEELRKFVEKHCHLQTAG
jgi:hypothetical protein